MSTDTPERLTPDELRTLFLFEALDEDKLRWLSENGRVESWPAGGLVFEEGARATCFYVLIEGTLAMTRRVQGDDVELNRTSQRGVYAGATRAWVPNAEREKYYSSVRAITDCRFLMLPAREFGAKLREWLPMAVHLLDGLYYGMRNSGALVDQRERLLSLGRLTAGLTHELNNPAAAAVRATSSLRERVAGMRGKLKHLGSGKVDPDSLVLLTTLQEDAIERAAKAPKRTPLQVSDAEDELADVLEERGISAGWQLTPVFVAAGLDAAWVDDVAAQVPAGHLEGGLRWIAYALETEQLMSEIEDSVGRVSSLVAAAKQYSQMDRVDYQTIDVHDGLDSTLVMLNRKLGDVRLEKDYDRSLPRIPAFPAELNQVWTNLVDNAIGAMAGSGVLTVRTSLDGDRVLVEICDTGPGVPAELRGKIFEPFFTTKPVGEGTGLGLDISWRIVVTRHGGDLRVTSAPGDTRFQVRLPVTPRPADVAVEDQPDGLLGGDPAGP